jgi:hypothetical protein
MYSPQIAEDLIPVLYHLAKQNKRPMTQVLDDILRKALLNHSINKTNEPKEVYHAGTK